MSEAVGTASTAGPARRARRGDMWEARAAKMRWAKSGHDAHPGLGRGKGASARLEEVDAEAIDAQEDVAEQQHSGRPRAPALLGRHEDEKARGAEATNSISVPATSEARVSGGCALPLREQGGCRGLYDVSRL